MYEKTDTNLKKLSSWIISAGKSRNLSEMSEIVNWKFTTEFFRRRPQSGRGHGIPKWWFIYYPFSKFYYSYNSKRWDYPLSYTTNSTKLHRVHINTHLQAYTLLHLYIWLGQNSKCWRPTHQYLPSVQLTAG